MKKIIQPLIIAALLFFLFTKSCGRKEPEPKIVTIEVPAQSGGFEAKEPEHSPVVDSTANDSVEVKWKTLVTENPVNKKLVQENKKLLEKYKNAKDSLERYKMYVQAVQLRNFSSHFEDDYIDLTITGKVQGKVKSITPKYTIKPRTVKDTVYPEETVFRVLAGFEIGNNTSLNDFKWKVNLGIQNRKGNVFKASYAKWYGQDYIFIGYDFSLAKITR